MFLLFIFIVSYHQIVCEALKVPVRIKFLKICLLNKPEVSRLTSDDAEELFDPHVDVDPAEELVHVAPPLLQDGAGRLAGLDAGSTGSTGNAGRRESG